MEVVLLQLVKNLDKSPAQMTNILWSRVDRIEAAFLCESLSQQTFNVQS